MKNNERLNRLPINVQEEVKDKLKGWDGCYVEQNEETKEYRVSTGIGITKWYNPWKAVEAFKSSDIYTAEEIRKYSAEYWQGVEMY